MKISTSKVFASALVAIMFSVFSTSNSKAAEALKIGPAEISFNAGYVTQYVWRGEDQNSSSGAPSFGADIALPYNIYVGAWTSSASWTTDIDQEVDIYAGIAPTFGDFSLDIGFIEYRYPGADENNFAEFYYGVAYAPEGKPYSFGVTYSDNDTNDSSLSKNIEYTASYDIFSITYGDFDTSRTYTNFSVAKEYAGVEFALTYTDVDWDAASTARDNFLVLSLSKSF
jgi:uncharacterized protein (TIGR02001 family)